MREERRRVIVKNFLTIPREIRGMKGRVIEMKGDECVVEVGEGECSQTHTLPERYLEEDKSRRRSVL